MGGAYFLLDESPLEAEIQKILGVPAKIAVAQEKLELFELSSLEKETYFSYKGTRLKSWLIGRKALKQLLRKLNEPDDTSGLKFPNPHFSLTHTQDTAIAAGILPEQSCFYSGIDGLNGKERISILGIGVDLEIKRRISFDSSRFFLAENEKKWVSQFDSKTQEQELLRLWTIKEALYKSHLENKKTHLFHYTLKNLGQSSGEAFFLTRDRFNTKPISFKYVSFQLPLGFFSFSFSYHHKQAYSKEI